MSNGEEKWKVKKLLFVREDFVLLNLDKKLSMEYAVFFM
jgi:hypothetical protein